MNFNRAKNHKRYMKEVWYPKNRKKHIKYVHARTKIIQQRNRDLINGIKKKYGCRDCGINNPIVLDFDHVRGKKIFCIAVAIRFHSKKRILKEISKCEIRCSNCHRIVTHMRRLGGSTPSPAIFMTPPHLRAGER